MYPRQKMLVENLMVLLDTNEELVEMIVTDFCDGDIPKLATIDTNLLPKMSKKTTSKMKAISSFIYQLAQERDTPVKITGSRDSYEYVKKYLYGLSKEHFCGVFLNKGNKVIKSKVFTTGSKSATMVDNKEILRTAVICDASAMIIAHNHPSNTLRPSQQDIEITKKLKSAAEFLDVALIDSIVFTDNGYYSFADEGML